METVAGVDVGKLTPEDLSRLHRSLMRRFCGHDGRNIVTLSFGAKQTGGRTTGDDVPSVRFLVRNKRDAAKSRYIPPEVTVRLLRSSFGHPVRVRLLTDVEEIARIKATGVRVRASNDSATAGLVFRVRRRGRTGNSPAAFNWSALSVNHFLLGLRVPIDVQLAGRGANAPSVPATVYLRSTRRENFDLAVCDAKFEALRQSNLLDRATTTLRIRSEQHLYADAAKQTAGLVFRQPRFGGVASFKVVDYAPQFPLGSLGTVNNVIRIKARQDGVFRPGTSGSVCEVAGQLVGILTAAEDGDRVGYVQALFSSVDNWISRHTPAVPEIRAAY